MITEPSIRESARGAVASPVLPTFQVHHDLPFDRQAMLAFFRIRAVAGAVSVDADSYTRSIRVSGSPAVITIRYDVSSVGRRCRAVADVAPGRRRERRPERCGRDDRI
jgi:hypothetical protein